MSNQTQNILTLQFNNPSYWYDNPEMQDLMTTLSLKFKSQWVNWFAFNPEKNIGYNNFRYTEDEINICFSGDKITDIKDKILYYPILTMQTNSDYSIVKQSLDKILYGYLFKTQSGKEYQKPKHLIIPVLMHHNHFGSIFIDFSSSQPVVEFFNPFGNDSSYKDTEDCFLKYFNEEHKLTFNNCGKIYDQNGNITKNENNIYQRDGNSCGPYTIEKIINYTDAKLNGTAEKELYAQTDSSDTDAILKYRKIHAILNYKYGNNYSIPLTQSVKAFLNFNDKSEFPEKINIPVPKSAYQDKTKGNVGQKYNGIETIDDIDIFEASTATAKFIETRSKNNASIAENILKASKKPDLQEQPKKASNKLKYYLALLAAAIIIIAAVYYIKKSVNVQRVGSKRKFLNQLCL